MSERDLDIFYYGNAPAYHWLNHFHANKELILGTFLQKASHWDTKCNRHSTRDDATFKVMIASRDELHYVQMDVIGSLYKRVTPMDVLDAFDMPCCRVGFTWPDQKSSKTWILHKDHTHTLPQDTPEVEQTVSVYTDGKVISVRHAERLAKYKMRGYGGEATCTCNDIIDKLEHLHIT